METAPFLIRELKGVAFGVAPIVCILLIIRLVVFRSPLESNRQFVIGSAMAVLGLFFFLQGARMGIVPLAESAGAELHRVDRGLIILFAFAIGFAATLVEPALTAVAVEAENTSVGAVTPRLVMGLTAFGFACGMALGVTKIVYNIDFLHILVPALAILAVLGYFCDKTFAALAFDCAGAATGPVNIPVNMAIALGLAHSVEGVDPLSAGFGIVGLTVLGVAGSIMAMGVIKNI